VTLDGLRRLVARWADRGGIPRGQGPRKPATVEEMMPGQGLPSVGNGDFRAIGLAFVEDFKRSCGLLPHHSVLDVGCGTGRIAIPLTQYLSPEGRYEGFDPVGEAIRHCRSRITPSYPNFRFQIADLYNRTYNPGGRFKDFDFRFPYPADSFDLVFAASVFTHLLPEGTERYVAESARVLKPGGHISATWFLLNEASLQALDAGKSTINFPWQHAVHRTHSREEPEAAVAYEEPFILGLYARHGLSLKEPARYGLWSGRPPSGFGGYQDLIVATKDAR
jgi:SAM-dependent methyltransferase